MSEVNPIEAVARAIKPNAWAALDLYHGDDSKLPEHTRSDLGMSKHYARVGYVAALTALSENITVEMVEAGLDAPLVALGNGQYRDPHPADVFRAMLNKAMKEQG